MWWEWIVHVAGRLKMKMIYARRVFSFAETDVHCVNSDCKVDTRCCCFSSSRKFHIRQTIKISFNWIAVGSIAMCKLKPYNVTISCISRTKDTRKLISIFYVLDFCQHQPHVTYSCRLEPFFFLPSFLHSNYHIFIYTRTIADMYPITSSQSKDWLFSIPNWKVDQPYKPENNWKTKKNEWIVIHLSISKNEWSWRMSTKTPECEPTLPFTRKY